MLDFSVDWMQSLSMLLRVAVAGVLASAIGFEREYVQRNAGMRTHILVAIGAALVMCSGEFLAVKYPHIDPARVGAQVVSGIGFLCAGTIIKEGISVRGLTTGQQPLVRLLRRPRGGHRQLHTRGRDHGSHPRRAALTALGGAQPPEKGEPPRAADHAFHGRAEHRAPAEGSRAHGLRDRRIQLRHRHQKPPAACVCAPVAAGPGRSGQYDGMPLRIEGVESVESVFE